MNKNVKMTNPMKVITGPNTLELRQRLGTEVHQWRHSEVQCQPDYPEV